MCKLIIRASLKLPRQIIRIPHSIHEGIDFRTAGTLCKGIPSCICDISIARDPGLRHRVSRCVGCSILSAISQKLHVGQDRTNKPHTLKMAEKERIDVGIDRISCFQDADMTEYKALLFPTKAFSSLSLFRTSHSAS